MEVAVEQITKCYHCGETCENESILFEDKNFCCNGCKVVYELLEENNLCEYYALNEKPGTSLKNSFLKDKYAYLDDEETSFKLIDFKDDKISKITFHVPSMHCSSCIMLLENLFKLNPGITQSRVNFLKKEIAVTFNHQDTSLRKVVELLASLGYEPSITLADANQKKIKKTNRKLIYQIGIAGFCFGNIMLLSLPEYFSNNDFFENFQSSFAWLNVLLTLPVFFYSAQPYFQSAWVGWKTRTLNIDVPIAIGFVSLMVVSLYDIIFLNEAGYLDTFTGLVFFLLTGRYYQQKTHQFLSFERDYKSYFPISVTIFKDKATEVVPLEKLKPGHRILVKNGDLVPADSLLIKGNGLIDYSFVTGESEPVEKGNAEIIFAGGRQVGGAIELEVLKEPAQSYLTQLWNNDTFTKENEGSLSLLSNKISKIFTISVLLIALGTVIYWLVADSSMALKAFTSVLIIACPCAFALSIPFTTGNVLRIFGKNRFYIKNTEVIEKLALADTIVFDKTGTLSESANAHVEWVGQDLTIKERSKIKSVLRNSSHPLSVSIFHSLKDLGEYPVYEFNEYKGLGISAYVENTQVVLGNALITSLKTDFQERKDGSRVYVRINDQVKGYYEIKHVYREGIKEMIAKLSKRYKLFVLSGDNDAEREELTALFDGKAELYFNQSPHDKLAFIENLEVQGNKTIMVGDGLNDAGALKRSFVGIAVSENAARFTPACDAILDAHKLSSLDTFIDFSKESLKLIKAGFIFSLIYNFIALSMAVQGIFTPLISAILMPVSSASLVTFATLTVRIAAGRRKL